MHIFLTGANGFLGTVLLRELLIKGHTITALVRAKGGMDAHSRLKETLLDYDPSFPYDQVVERTLFVVEGNATQNKFGLDERSYLEYARRSDIILHNLACTALETDWNIYEEVNIGSARKAIEFASHTRRKALAYVSSAYVAGARTGLVLESELDMSGSFRSSYERSKAMAENEVRIAASSGNIQTMIFRPSIIVGDSRNGWMCEEHHFFDFIRRLSWVHRLIHGRTGSDGSAADHKFRLLGDPQTTKNFIPVDHVAKLISILVDTDPAWGRSFHLTHPEPISLKNLMKYVQGFLCWPELTWCSKEDVQDLSSLERRFARSTRIYERYFWQEPSFDQGQLKSVLGTNLPRPHALSKDLVSRMVGFVQKKSTQKEILRKEMARGYQSAGTAQPVAF
ncbi:MAG: SDR family oxidoreductase [Candidatus Omnitrophota bacterium]|jgi:thioester reductase-like protein